MFEEILIGITKSMLKGESLDKQEIIAKGYEELKEIFGEEVADLMLERFGGLFDERIGDNNRPSIDPDGRIILDSNPMEHYQNEKSLIIISKRGSEQCDRPNQLPISENGANDNGSDQENQGGSRERDLTKAPERDLNDRDPDRKRVIIEYELRDPKKSKLSEPGVQGDPELDS
jgi:hypothetical protein